MGVLAFGRFLLLSSIAAWSVEATAQAGPPPQVVINQVTTPGVLEPGEAAYANVTLTNVGTLPVSPAGPWLVSFVEDGTPLTIPVGTSTVVRVYVSGSLDCSSSSSFCRMEALLTLVGFEQVWMASHSYDQRVVRLTYWQDWPDITGEIISGPRTVSPGGSFLVQTRLTNDGFVPWVLPLTNAIRYVTAPGASPWTELTTPGLSGTGLPIAAGETRIITSTVTVPIGLPLGTYTLGLELGDYVGSNCRMFLDLECADNYDYTGPQITVVSPTADAGVADASPAADAGASPLDAEPDAGVADAEPPLDAGVTSMDAAPAPDLGVAEDAMPPLDTGVAATDAAPPPDLGVAEDAMPPLDTGVAAADAAPPPDLGLQSDASATASDAGTPADAGNSGGGGGGCACLTPPSSRAPLLALTLLAGLVLTRRRR